MKRIFAAIDISGDVRAAIALRINEARKMTDSRAAAWVAPEKLHITMRFLGQCSESDLAAVTAGADACAAEASPFQLSIGGPGAFPSARRPRVLWLGVAGNVDALNRLAQKLDGNLERLGLPAGKKPFAPHLTIARIKHPTKCPTTISTHLALQFDPTPFSVTVVLVYESTLHSAGSSYEIVSRHPFGK